MMKDKKTLYIVIISSLLIAVLLNSPVVGAMLLQDEFIQGRRLTRLGYNLFSNFVMAIVLFQFNLVWKYTKLPVLSKLLNNWLVVILCNVLIVIVLGYLIKELGGFDPPRRGRFMMRYGIFINLSSMVVIIMLISRLLEVLFSRQQVALENEKLRNESLQNQYNALKSQLDPHFLFNSLNTVLELIEEDKELAKGFVARLSEVFRYMLGHSKKQLIALQDEITLTKDYLYLLKIRHSHLDVNFGLAEDRTHWEVPPLALQLLIENAVKHNEISRLNPLTIHVTQIGDLLEVTNIIQPKRSPATGAGTGLSNLVERYRIVAGRSVIIENEQGIFKVVIPLIRKNQES